MAPSDGTAATTTRGSMTVGSDHTPVHTRAMARVADGLRAWVRRPRFRGAALAALVVLLHLVGALAALDHASWVQRWAVDPEVPRATTPIVLSIDDATIELLGPPQWSDETWARVAEDVRMQGLDEVILVDPWPLLRRPGAATEPGDGATLLVPELEWAGEPVDPSVLPAPFQHLPLTLAAPRSPAEPFQVGQSPPSDPSWLPCALAGACPPRGGRAWVGLRTADVAVVSLRDLLDVDEPFLRPPASGAILALTASPWAPTVAVGPDAKPLPWGVAVASLVGNAHQYGATSPASQRPVLAWLIAWFAAATLAHAAQVTRAWLTVAPLLAVATLFLVERSVGVLFPPVATALVTAAPALSRELARLRTTSIVARRMGLLVLRAATRAGMLRRAVRTRQELTAALADLTRSHLANRDFCHLHRVPHTSRLAWAGGYGIQRSELRPNALTTLNPILVELAATDHGGVVRGLLRNDGALTQVVPLRQSGELVGFWVLAVPENEANLDLRQVGSLAAWLSERLALEDAPNAFGGSAGLVPENAWDDTLERLFRATETERTRWLRCLRAIGAPLLVADATGVVSDLNPSMVEALKLAGLPRMRSLRELLFRVDGEARLDAHISRLFAEGRATELVWPTPSGTARLHVTPVLPEQGEHERTYGFVAWVVEAVDEAAHRAQEDRIRHWTATLEERLSTVMDAAESLSGADAAARRHHMVRFLRQQLADLEDDLQDIGGAFDPNRAMEPGPVDIPRLLGDEARRLGHLIDAADLTLEQRMPDTAPVAEAVAWQVQQGTRALLESAISLAQPGSTVLLEARLQSEWVFVRVRFDGTADELVRGLRTDLPLDAVAAEVRGLARARSHFEHMRITTDEKGRVTAAFSLPEAKGVTA